MKKSIVFSAVIALFAMALAVSAQDNKKTGADFSGKWVLDVAKSDLGQIAGAIKSQTLTITQSGTSLKIATQTERAAPPDGGGGAGAGGAGARGGFGGGGGAGAGPAEQSYTLDGKEVTSERQTPNGTFVSKTKAEQSGSKISISNTRSTPNGDTTMTTTYELSSDGKSLTVVRPAGQGGTTKWVYTKG